MNAARLGYSAWLELRGLRPRLGSVIRTRSMTAKKWHKMAHFCHALCHSGLPRIVPPAGLVGARARPKILDRKH